MSEAKPRWNRRKEARPAEIIDAAMDVFIERGFAAAKLDDVARRAGIAKGTLYRYFATKENMFRAVARHAIAGNLRVIEQAATGFEGSLTEILPVILARMADSMGDPRLPAIARMVLADSRAFPDLARIWHDDVVSRILPLLAGFIRAGQVRNEISPGDPELHAFSIIGAMMAGLLFREVFGAFSPHAPDLHALAAQHARTVLHGLLAPPGA